MPLSKESVEDTATPAEHGPLYLVDVGAPVFGLRWGWGRGLRKRSPNLRGGAAGVESAGRGPPTLQKVSLQWQELSCVFRMSTSP